MRVVRTVRAGRKRIFSSRWFQLNVWLNRRGVRADERGYAYPRGGRRCELSGRHCSYIDEVGAPRGEGAGWGGGDGGAEARGDSAGDYGLGDAEHGWDRALQGDSRDAFVRCVRDHAHRAEHVGGEDGRV